MRAGRLVTILATSLAFGFAGASCGVAEDEGEPLVIAESAGGEAFSSMTDELTGCNHRASAWIPPSGSYVLTTFGGPTESGTMACGQTTRNGTWYYAASRQRYGCGGRIKVQANGKCVVVETDDYGPDVCVEKAVGRPVLDASPLVARYLFGVSSAGWSEGRRVLVTKVPKTTPLGPCR